MLLLLVHELDTYPEVFVGGGVAGLGLLQVVAVGGQVVAVRGQITAVRGRSETQPDAGRR